MRHTEVLARKIKQGNETKGIQIRKEEVKLSLFADDMILYIENPKDSTQNCWNKLKNSVNLQDIKSTYRNQLHLYTLIIKSGKEIKKTISLTTSSKTTKYL